MNDLVSVSDDVSLDSGTGDFSVAAWIKVDGSSLQSTTEYGVVNKNAYFQGTPGWGMEIHTYGETSGQFATTFAITSQGSWGNTNVVYRNQAAGVWHHIVGVRQVTTTTLYFDGVQRDQTVHSDAALSVDNSQPLVIGDHVWGPNFPGLIDEVQLYDRALSLAEIEILAGTSDQLFVDDDGQVGFGTSIDCDGVGIGAYTVIQDAVAVAGSGDTVLLCDGTYRQSVDIGTSGITLSAVDGASPILDGTGTVDAGATLDTNFGIRLLDSVREVTIENLEIRHYHGPRGSAISAWDVSTSDIRIENNYILHNAWNGILVGSEGGYVHDNWMVKNNWVENNGYVGIELTNCASCTIMKNDVDGGSFGIVVQARNTVTGSGLVAIDGVHILHNTIDGATYYGIYVLSFTGHPTAFTPITGASSLLTSVNVQRNTITDSGGSRASIRFWAYNDAATADNGRISNNEIDCPSTTPGIQILESGSGSQEGTVNNVKVVNNSFDSECIPDITNEGEATKLPPGPFP